MYRYSRLIVAAAMAMSPLVGALLAAAVPPIGGTVSIEFAGDDNSASRAAFAEALGEVLAAKGMTVLQDEGHAAYVVELKLMREEVGTGSAKVARGKVEFLPGALGVGAGATLPLSAGETRLVPLQRVRIDMRIRKRGESEAVWTGAALTVRAAGTPKGSDAAVATDLSQALLRVYPAQPGDVIAIP
jgi:hypothetical protein